MDDKVVSVLLIEDDADDVFLLRKLLEAAAPDRFHLTVATRLGEAADLLAGERPEAVLLDLTLPDSHGLETFTDFHARFPELPVVVLTGLDDEETAVRAVQEGAQDYLVKGQGDGALLARSLRYAIERQRSFRYRALLLERERFDAAIAEMTDGIVVTDCSGRITTANHAACLLLNLPAARCTSLPLEAALARFELSLPLSDLFSLPETATAFEISRPHTRPPLFLDARLSRLFDEAGELLSLVLVLRDVTDERHARHVQTTFFLMVSHKLRTPLSVIVGYLDLLKRLPEEQLQREWEHIVEVLDREVGRLHDMVQRLLEFKEMDQRELEAEGLGADLGAVLAGAAEQVRRRHPERCLQLTSTLDAAACRADMTAEDAHFVLEQLLDNAVKFSEGDEVGVQVLVTEADGHLQVSVVDDGRGIPHEYFDRIFSGFVQVEDHATGQVPGLGVGLCMARQVVEAYGGEMTVESKLGEGSVFSFTVPVAKDANGSAAEA